jgi:hypothetical protein
LPGAPVVDRLQARQQRRKVKASAAGEDVGGLVVDRQRPLRE